MADHTGIGNFSLIERGGEARSLSERMMRA
jgi:hypothetical protein